MKVVKMGPAFLVEWKAQATCKKCHSVVELETKDVKLYTSEGDWYNSASTSLTWTCPLCEQSNYLGGDTRKSFIEGHPQKTIY